MKIQYLEKLINAHLNINSIRNKFHSLSFMTENDVDMLLISETKPDDSFSKGQFKICGLVCLTDIIEAQWVVDFHFILQITFEPNF